jgi:hypothetical protein
MSVSVIRAREPERHRVGDREQATLVKQVGFAKHRRPERGHDHGTAHAEVK